jgi:hypothetical protein
MEAYCAVTHVSSKNKKDQALLKASESGSDGASEPVGHLKAAKLGGGSKEKSPVFRPTLCLNSNKSVLTKRKVEMSD